MSRTKNMSFLCPCLEMCYLRRKFAEQFPDFTGGDRNYIGHTGFLFLQLWVWNFSSCRTNHFFFFLILVKLFFLRLRTFFVRLAVPSKSNTAISQPTGSQPIWLKSWTHQNLNWHCCARVYFKLIRQLVENICLQRGAHPSVMGAKSWFHFDNQSALVGLQNSI